MKLTVIIRFTLLNCKDIKRILAKAMPEDKAKSLEAGANDYLTKPVNIEKLLDIGRLWLYQ